MNFFEAPVLENAFVRLEPISASHHDDLANAVQDGDLDQVWYTQHVPSPDLLANTIQQRIDALSERTMVTWAILDPANDRAVGMTSYLHTEPENQRLEIGSTWLRKSAQKTKINPAAKLLLLERAFDDLDCIAVELRTHWHNQQSRAAIERLGAKQDGVLRNHMVFDNGTIRDTVVYSILDSEWPAVKTTLTERLRD